MQNTTGHYISTLDGLDHCKFKKCSAGLYYYDTEKLDEHEMKVDFNFVQTEADNLANKSQEEKKKMKLVRYYQELFAWPSKKI